MNRKGEDRTSIECVVTSGLCYTLTCWIVKGGTHVYICVCVCVCVCTHTHTHTHTHVQDGAEEHPRAFRDGSPISLNPHFGPLYQSRRIVALFVFIQLKCSFITPKNATFTYTNTVLRSHYMFRRHSRHRQRTPHQNLQQITRVLQLCYIVLTANVEHAGFANCDENNICMYFTYNIKTVKDRVCYVTSFKYGCKVVRWYCSIAQCQGTLQHSAQCVCVQTAMCVECKAVHYGLLLRRACSQVDTGTRS